MPQCGGFAADLDTGFKLLGMLPHVQRKWNPSNALAYGITQDEHISNLDEVPSFAGDRGGMVDPADWAAARARVKPSITRGTFEDVSPGVLPIHPQCICAMVRLCRRVLDTALRLLLPTSDSHWCEIAR